MFYLFIIIFILFLLILLLRTLKSGIQSRKLSHQPNPSSISVQEKYARRLSEMIKCATVSVKGSHDDKEYAKLRSAVSTLFPLLHSKSELKIFSSDCWLYHIQGADRNRRIMLMSHHDVAPVTGNWEHEPFGGEIHDGRLWGRGTVDTKTSLFAEMQALEELFENEWKPPCDVYLSSSCNEEVAGDGIPLVVDYFKSKNETFDVVLDEGGAVLNAPMPGISCKCAMVAVHEKGRLKLNFTASDGPSHSGLNSSSDLSPIVRVSKFIEKVADKPPFIKRLHPQVKAMFEHLSPYMTFPMRLVFSNLWFFGPLIIRLMPVLNKQAGAMVGTTISFTDIESKSSEGGEKTCKVEALVRGIKEDDLEKDVQELNKIALKYGIEMSQGDENEFHKEADMNQPGFSYVKECIEKVFPHAACAPFILPAGTDGRHFSDICRCVMRFAPIDIDKQQFASVHSPNENISLTAIPQAVVFYKEFLLGLPKLVNKIK